MSGCSVTIHSGTYQPMIPVTPLGPASWATAFSVMYVASRSGWPQFSRMTSTSPVSNPGQATSSATDVASTV